MGQIRFQQPFNRPWRLRGRDVAVDFPPELRVRAEPTAGEQMIGLDCIVLLTDRNLGGDQPDVADIMLRARMMAAGEMYVQRRVDRHSRLTPVTNVGSMAFCVRRGELAASIPGTGDQSGPDLRRLDRQPDRFNGGYCNRDVLVAHT